MSNLFVNLVNYLIKLLLNINNQKVRNDLLRYSKNYQKNAVTTTDSMTSSTTSFSQHHTSELESLIEELEHDKPTSISQMDTISQGVANFEANKLLYMTSNGSEMDLSLISKLQRRIAALELEKKSANHLSMPNSSTSPSISASTTSTNTTTSTSGAHDNNNNHPALIVGEDGLNLIERLQQDKDYELIKSQELELENQRLRDDINRLVIFFVLLSK